jgi:porphobilinogen synthase
MSKFPQLRLRRLRSSPATRSLLAETRVHPHDLIAPLFVVEGKGQRRAISSLPGQFHLSVDQAVIEAEGLFKLGIPGVMLFGIPGAKAKSDDARASWAKDGIVQRALRALKKAVPQLLVFTDVCVCEYTSHGHCGLVEARVKGGHRELIIANDASLVALRKMAVSHADAGADWVAPSDMMDGRVGGLREALDAAGHAEVGILAYSAKFASAFYGPFREAADSAPSFGDRRSHQMDPPNAREALREMQLDLDEGADMLMVKPALPYLDIIAKAREAFRAPIVAYNVSGEYSMVHAAAAKGWGDLRGLRDESLASIKRAGADIIITYWARAYAADFRARGGLDGF